MATQSLDLPLDQIDANPYQPRRTFNQDELNDLAQSIKDVGVLQDVIVRPLPNKRYQLVSGERRTRASHLAGLKTIPAKVRDLTDLQVSQLALVENVQRADLNPMEEARGIERHIRLSAENGEEMSFNDVRKMLGKSEGWMNKKKALLKLPDYMQEVVDRNGAVQSSVLEINRLPEVLVEERHALVAEIDGGATYQPIKDKVETLLAAHADKEAWRKESQEAPDKHTRDAQARDAKRDREARREFEAQMGNAESALLNASSWVRRINPEDFKTIEPRIERLRRKIDEITQEVTLTPAK